MANPTIARPFDFIYSDFKKAGFSDYTIRALRDVLTRSDKVLTDQGSVQAVAPIVGRTEGLGTTAQNLDVTGKLLTTDAIAADGIGSPLTGGKRGFVALDTNNRLTGAIRNNPVNVTGTLKGANPLSCDNAGNITVASSQYQFDDSLGTITYSSAGSPLATAQAIGTKIYVYADDPTFAGGAVAYQWTVTQSVLAGAKGRVSFGFVTVPAGAPTGGTGGGTGGGKQPF